MSNVGESRAIELTFRERQMIRGLAMQEIIYCTRLAEEAQHPNLQRELDMRVELTERILGKFREAPDGAC